MPLLTLLILALVQGITEFLPVSSSGHLVLIHTLMDDGSLETWQNDLLIDVAVHVGTLFAVLLYFRQDLWDAAHGNLKLGKHVIIASIPVIIAGFIIHQLEPSILRSIEIMAWMTLIFGIALWWADKKYPSEKTLGDMTLKNAFMIGIAQALALVPGTSRSGITMTAARVLGYTRTESAHFSLLLSIIAISGAGFLGALNLIKNGSLELTIDALLAMGLAFLAGYIAIALMMEWLKRATFTPFAIYRIALGLILLSLIYTGSVPQL